MTTEHVISSNKQFHSPSPKLQMSTQTIEAFIISQDLRISAVVCMLVCMYRIEYGSPGSYKELVKLFATTVVGASEEPSIM